MAVRLTPGLLALGAAAFMQALAGAQTAASAWTANIADVRAADAVIPKTPYASFLPTRRPLRINVVKFAESRRTKNFSVKGAPAEPSVQARTAFQIVYAEGTVMVDTGMDLQVHKFFGRGVEEPYDAEAASEVERALRNGRLILVTHEHGDHVGGVIRSPAAAELARKTILTRAQIQSLMAMPQMPEIKLTDDAASHFIVVDYDKYLTVAPGITLIKSPGHTPGSQMVYVALDSGREYLLIGDAAWHMDGVRLVVGKDAPWVTEDQNAIMDQLRWLNALSSTERNLVIVASHDDEQHKELEEKGLLGKKFE